MLRKFGKNEVRKIGAISSIFRVQGASAQLFMRNFDMTVAWGNFGLAKRLYSVHKHLNLIFLVDEFEYSGSGQLRIAR